MKICSSQITCTSDPQPLENFNTAKDTKDGHTAACRNCRNLSHKLCKQRRAQRLNLPTAYSKARKRMAEPVPYDQNMSWTDQIEVYITKNHG